MMTTTRTNENGYDGGVFKTPLRNPLRTPVRNGMLSSVTLNDLSSYSNNNNNKHLKFVNTTSMNDFQTCLESITTPIRANKTKFNTPISTQRRRALGLVNHNSNRICRVSSIDDSSGSNTIKDKIESTISHNTNSHPEDDLPHNNHSYQDTFDDLMTNNERVERIFTNQSRGVNIINFNENNENRIRCQSPMSSHVNVSTLLDMFDMF